MQATKTQTHIIDELIHRLANHDGTVRHDARVALVSAGLPTVHALMGTLSSSNADARWEAAKALSELRDPEAAPALVTALLDEQPGVRWLAAEALALIGRPALEPLLHGLIEHSGSPWFRDGAHHVLRTFGTGTLDDMLKPLIDALEGRDQSIGVLIPAHELLESLSEARAAL